MKKIIFWGDGVLAGPSGYAEILSDLIFLNHPGAQVITFAYGGENPLQSAQSEAPLHVIGKAPDLVVLGFGHNDLLAGATPEDIGKTLLSLVELLLQKTHADICLSNLISSFFPEAAEKQKCAYFNKILQDIDKERVKTLDLEQEMMRFLKVYQRGGGEKRSLHQGNGKLTLFGRLFLAQSAYAMIPWPALEKSPELSGSE